jgi:hypothetical protein
MQPTVDRITQRNGQVLTADSRSESASIAGGFTSGPGELKKETISSQAV